MFIFLKLALAHLAADFVFQFKELFRLKLERFSGHFLHALCHALVSLALLFPYVNHPFIWFFILGISGVHLLQDLLKYRFMGNTRAFFLVFVADQIGHFLMLSTIFLFPNAEALLGIPPIGAALSPGDLHQKVTLYAIAFIAATFCGSYTLHAFRRSYVANTRDEHFITEFELAHGIVERTAVAGTFLLCQNPLLWLVSLVVGVARLPSKLLRSKVDFLLSFGYAAAAGLLFRLWL